MRPLRWLRVKALAIADRLTGRHRTLSLVANWLANQLWLMETTFIRLATEAYGANGVVYACLRLLSQSVPEAPLRAYAVAAAGARVELEPEHPLRRLIARPNSLMTEYEMWELLTLHMALVGRSVWWKERDNAGRIIALWPLRPDRVGPIYARSDDPDNRVLAGWSYQLPDSGEFVPLVARDCVMWNFPNPLGASGGLVEGFGPLQALAREVSADNEATDFVGALLANYAAPTVALKVKDAIVDQTEAAMIKARFRAEFGQGGRGGVALLDGESDVQVIGFNLQELEFPGVRANTESRICAALGVPPSLVGVNVGLRAAGGLGGGGALTQWRQYFAETTLANYWRRYCDRFQLDVAAEFGDNIVVEFDLSQVQAFAARQAAQIEPIAVAYQQGALTRNEYRAALGYDTVDGGDVFVLPANVIEVPVVQEAAVVKAARVIVARALREADPRLLAEDDGLKK